MNEIEKLKIEHARYHKALKQIRCDYAIHTSAGQGADAALNPPPPPPPPPVTLAVLQKAANLRAGSVELFGDGSVIWSDLAGNTEAFTNVEALMEFLEARPV